MPERPHTSKPERLRRLLEGADPVRAVGAHNGLTARLAERAGFEAVWSSSFELSASQGLPDASLLGLAEFVDAAEAMDAAADLPVIADCDTGFGGPLNVAHALRRFERRGAAAICIEDKVFPKMNSFARTAHDLVPTEEFALKLKSGLQARTDPDFLLIARTEALIAGQGVPEALERARAYAAAGADAVLVHSKSTRPDDILEFGARWDGGVPLVAVPTTYGQVHERELFDAGYRIVIYANHGLRAAVSGVTSTLAALAASGRARDVEDGIATMPELFELQRMPADFKAAP
ncbi:isocitrate lyase/phosphoenolpyruvate mutase family protein [Nocardiopsis chromatogenes]|uniref:isocitrate lyase/phosphoenolpyruvate mutase family protein n=1 Tax=Nocardiopsis chromatogenes TaxID=280239 RepID=UPI000475C5CA|nr:isocitrate lyase/phosphoenolpyruvate mutase family protein [Nocardiopsis chromatogenes]